VQALFMANTGSRESERKRQAQRNKTRNIEGGRRKKK
jgi:hypothetical protein